jgi:hypothetical protein
MEFNQNNEQNGQLSEVIYGSQANNECMECDYNADTMGNLGNP